MKLVFATMIRAADRWCRVSISDLERHQLRLLRADLGLDPPPTTDEQKTPLPGAGASPHDHPGHPFTGTTGLDPSLRLRSQPTCSRPIRVPCAPRTSLRLRETKSLSAQWCAAHGIPFADSVCQRPVRGPRWWPTESPHPSPGLSCSRVGVLLSLGLVSSGRSRRR
jgi:hypothetical protein